MKTVETNAAPRPAGHYSQAIVHHGMVYAAGQLPVDPVSGEKRLGTVEEQTEQALSNLRAVLEAAGSGLDRVVKTTVYITDIGLWDRVNHVYGQIFGANRPARSIVPVKELHFGFLIEIDAIAAIEYSELEDA